MMGTSTAVSTSVLTRTMRPEAIVMSILSDLGGEYEGGEGLAGSAGNSLQRIAVQIVLLQRRPVTCRKRNGIATVHPA